MSPFNSLLFDYFRYYKGNYSMFKKMEQQKRRERIKDYEKQEKRLKELKAAGQSKKKAESKQKEALTRKQEKNKTKLTKNNDEDTGPQELLERPKEYQVRQHKMQMCHFFLHLNLLTGSLPIPRDIQFDAAHPWTLQH